MIAEGVTRLNQQVVNVDGWALAERVSSFEGRLAPESAQGAAPPRPGNVRRAVEAEVIPRLLLGRSPGESPASASPTGTATEAEIQRFARLLLSPGDGAAALAYLTEIQARGWPVDLIYLNLFQPAARYIGELWCQDLCTFIDVTLAVGTMQTLLRTFGPEFHKDGRAADTSRLAMLAPLPGDQHTFGLSMVAEFFRRGGWTVSTAPFATVEDLSERVHSTWFAVVGFSASHDERLDELACAIRTVRKASLNAAVGVLVGGPVFVDRPDLARRIGADVLGGDALQALIRAEGFISPAPGA